MFVRNSNNLPAEPQYPSDIKGLGYGLSRLGEIVSIANPSEHFNFFITDSERANELHKEAMHNAVRMLIKERLVDHGVEEYYLTSGLGGARIQEVKPEAAHISVLATDLEKLKDKKDVIVVVGEHTQDPGIWAWRTVTGAGGLSKGSAIGLMELLSTKGALGGPGVIVLNPGQRLYSPEFNRCMTQVSWYARPKTHALEDSIRIHDECNRISGHKTAEEHLATMFDRVIPQMCRKDVELYVVGICDGAESFINYMDRELVKDHDASIQGRIAAMAFMQPTHTATKVQSFDLKLLLHSRAKAWIIEPGKATGTFLNAPGATKPILLDDEEEMKRSLRIADHLKPGAFKDESAGDCTNGKEHASTSKNDDDMAASMDELSLADKDNPIVGSVPSLIEKPYDVVDFEPTLKQMPGNNFQSGSLESNSSIDPNELLLSGSIGDRLCPSTIVDNCAETDSPPKRWSTEPLGPSIEMDWVTKPKVKLEAKPKPKKSLLSEKLAAGDALAREDDSIIANPGTEKDDTPPDPVSCPTYAANVDYAELIFPEVMELMVDWFETVRKGDYGY